MSRLISRRVLVCFFLCASACVASAAPGPGPGPTQSGPMIGAGGSWATQLDRFTTEHFSGSGVCASCHEGLVDDYGEDVSIVSSWRPTMMRFAFVDPLWRAKVKSEMLRIPALADAIEEKCSRCHAPMASAEAEFAGEPISIFDGGITNTDHPLHAAASEGVSCTLCHQIQDSPELGTDAGMSGGFTIEDFGQPADREIYGRYADVFTSSMRNSALFTPTLGDQIERSAMCATCHQLQTAYVDAKGTPVEGNLFPEQMPYSEWLESDYGPDGSQTKACQDCHMVLTHGVRLASSPAWLPLRDPFYRHTFFTENTTILGILERNAEELGISSDGIAEAIEAAEEYLGEAATVEIVSATLQNRQLQARIRITNKAGHKIPTSIPIRRLYVHFTVTKAGRVVFESGKWNPDGSIEGVDSDANPMDYDYERHHDLITQSDQVQVYEGIMGNTDLETTYTLLRASHFRKDNRILPLGFDVSTAAVEVLPVGDCSGDSNFMGGSDELVYEVANLRPGTYTVKVELLDQSLSFPFVQDLLQDENDPIVAQFAEMYRQEPAPPQVVAEATRTVSY